MKFVPSLTSKEVESAFGGKFLSVSTIPDGIGGQGVVFKAQSHDLKGKGLTCVALKIYFPGSLPERTKREVQSLRRMSGMTLVKLHSAGDVTLRGQSCLYVATDFLEGDLLVKRIGGVGLGMPLCARIGHDIAMAIATMWEERIVHRDIKPTNIMLTNSGRAVLIDLGVARHLALDSLTSAGKTWGTQGYMSPEQDRTMRQLSCKSDLFSLGIVLQESLIGRHPVANSQISLSNGGPKTASLTRNLPVEFTDFVDSLVARDAHRRPIPSQAVEFFARHL